MSEPTSGKRRTPSRCREWERNRRNKFNDAVARLGDVVKEINRSLDSSSKETDNVQYPKIEIVEKAIVCLSNCIKEKTKLKSEILSLQVTIETYSKAKQNKQDASTQVFLKINKKKQDEETEKGVTSQKVKRNALKEKPVLAPNVTVDFKVTKSPSKAVVQAPPKSLPMLLPKTSSDTKGSKNTIVVLPAAPYILPQRPFILPTVSPAFVIVDHNIQTLNKPLPLVNRNNGDITKTTMVNILPISAYSHPLSASKNKKINKIDIGKKVSKKIKQKTKVKTNVIKNETPNIKESESIPVSEGNKENKNAQDSNNVVSDISKVTVVPVDITSNSKSVELSVKTNSPTEVIHIRTENINNTSNTNDTSEQTVEVKKLEQNDKIINENEIKSKTNKNNVNGTNKDEKTVCALKETVIEDKSKESKLPILPIDTSLCENENVENVDAGNARLELAEEFLAASPTAAFLMSFPLVSGNRADSPADETHSHNTIQTPSKDSLPRRNDLPVYFEKSYNKSKPNVPAFKTPNPPNLTMPKENVSTKFTEIANKVAETKAFSITTTANSTNENPFLNLSLPSLIPASCGLTDSAYGIDFDCNLSKSLPQTTNYASSSNIFYKSDPFNTVKSSIYSTSSIPSGHEFNSFGLYPCAMEKYTPKSKNDYNNMEDNLMKIGSSRLTYDIDLGWSHKGFDFVGSTSASSTFNKDMLTSTSGTYSSSYNPFTPDLHSQLTSSSSKKETTASKPNTSFSESFTNFYSQPTNLWSDDVNFYSNNSISKSLPTKHQTNFLPLENIQPNPKPNILKQYDTKVPNTNTSKTSIVNTVQQLPEKFTKKSPSKAHINWMTSETRPIHNSFNTSQEIKDTHKTTYSQLTQHSKKQDVTENNYFALPMHNFSSQTTQEELHVWTPARSAGTTEISIDPPPINLPTLVGDLALGPLEKKRNTELSSKAVVPDLQNCSNFLSVSQLMNRSSDSNISSRYQVPTIDSSKTASNKTNQNLTNDSNRKVTPRVDNYLPQSSYVFNDNRVTNSYETMNQYSQPKPKTKQEKNTKTQKNSYSAEALIRGATFTQKIPESNTKFMPSVQKYNDFSIPQDSSVAQVSHFPPIIDYSENNFTGQQYSGTTLYNSTTNTITNSFYSNFMPGSSNLMSGSYPSGPFPSDYMDYTQADCNYSNNKYEDLKVRNTPHVFQQDKTASNYKSSRRESATKHKLECSKKESNKKYPNKRPKVSTEIEEWNDTSHLIWQNKTPTKRHPNLMSDELSFPNYVSNQMPTQYQPDLFNSHLMPSNMQSVGHNIDRSLATFPVTSRANFNLSTIFPEIAMKVQ